MRTLNNTEWEGGGRDYSAVKTEVYDYLTYSLAKMIAMFKHFRQKTYPKN